MIAALTIVVTGANAGVGYQLSAKLARLGAHVVMACRNRERGKRAEERLHTEVPGARTAVLTLDVSEPASIREFGSRFADEVGQLDVLINNAGIYGVPLAHTSTGCELQLATNYLGPFALTGTLLGCFRDVRGARIVNVGSLAHRFGRLQLDDLYPAGEYNPWAAYARSKAALLSHTLELNRRLNERGSQIIALAAHPGFALTEGAKQSSVARSGNAVRTWLNQRVESWVPSAADAAAAILHAASSDEARGGEYYGPGGWFEIAGPPARARINRRAFDTEFARRLWSTSESLTGVRYL